MRYGRTYPARVIIKRPLVYVAAPTNFTVTLSSDGYATLTWTDVSDINTSYKLERKTGSNPYETLDDAISPTATSYADPEQLDENIAYTYRLRAVHSPSVGESTTVTVVANVPPREPSNLNAACTIRATSNGSKVLLSWEIYSLGETGFLIERSLDGSAWSTVTTTAAGVRTYEDTGLAHDTTYYYRVSAVGIIANSSPTTAVAVITSRGRVADLQLAFDKKIGQFPS